MHLDTKERQCCRRLSDKTNQSSSLIASVAEECLALSRINSAALPCSNWNLAIRVLLCLSPQLTPYLSLGKGTLRFLAQLFLAHFLLKLV